MIINNNCWLRVGGEVICCQPSVPAFDLSRNMQTMSMENVQNVNCKRKNTLLFKICWWRTKNGVKQRDTNREMGPRVVLKYSYINHRMSVEVCRDKYLFLQSRMILDDQVELVLRVSCTETLCNTLKGGTTSCMQKQCKISIILQKSNS